MIVQSKEMKTQSTIIDSLRGDAKNSSATKSNLLFSKLLSSLGVLTHDTTHTVIDPKNSVPKNPPYLKSANTKNITLKELPSLLQGEDKESTLVSKELLITFSDDQVRTLIHKAKEFLKNEIIQKAPEYQTDTKTLPKTLLGLVQLADKLGLDPQSVSLATLMNDNKERSTFSPELLTKPILDTKTLATLPMKAADQTAKEGVEKAEPQPLKTLLQALETRLETTQTSAVKANKSSTPTTIKTDSVIALLQREGEANTPKEESTLSEIKLDGTKLSQAHKAIDSIDVKAKEAQQSMRHFAGELKEAIQEYKPPLTRLSMKLNPEKLGEVEVTLVQRGNNVHVNIQSSNTTTVAFLAHNATELKAQLAHQGITDATMNFMSNGDNQQNSAQQQHRQEQHQNRYKGYQSLNELELNEEQLSALEIIIPHYA